MTDNTELLEGLSPVSSSRVVLSGLLNDEEKVGILRRLTPESRRQVMLNHASTGLAWEKALERAEYLNEEGSDKLAPGDDNEAAEPDAALEGTDERPQDGTPNRLVQRWRVEDLRPNKFNATLFQESLLDDSVQHLADTMDYQRVPIEITPQGVIIDGERRWRAAKLLGWEYVEVVVVGDLTDEEIKDRVLDSFGSTRDASLAEKARLFEALKEQLQRRHGRTPGRAEKLIPDGIIYDSGEIEEIAARKAGLPSARTAQRLGAVFQRGSKDLIDQVLSGSLSISKAYEELPKREKKSPKKTSSPSSYDNTRDHTELLDVSADERSGSSKEEEDADAYKADKVAHVDPGEEETHHPESDESIEEHNEDEVTDQSNDEPLSVEEVDETDDNEDGDPSEAAQERVSVDEALDVLAMHLAGLVADGGLKAARGELQSWVKWLFERAKAARDEAA